MGKTDLGKWMITNGGEYNADATYEQLTMVKYGNSTYITLKTVTGIAPVDDKINYQLMAQGFDATALSAVQAEDTQGLCGEKGNIVTAQSLVDALADKVINTVMAKIGTAALTGGMTDLSSGLNKLNSDLAMLNTNQNPTVYSKQILSSELIYNAWMKIIKIGRICIAWGSFVVKEEKNITNVDLFNISNTGITPMDSTTFSLSSFNPTDQGGIGVLNLDGKVVFALPESGTKEWRFNFSFVSS